MFNLLSQAVIVNCFHSHTRTREIRSTILTSIHHAEKNINFMVLRGCYLLKPGPPLEGIRCSVVLQRNS